MPRREVPKPGRIGEGGFLIVPMRRVTIDRHTPRQEQKHQSRRVLKVTDRARIPMAKLGPVRTLEFTPHPID